MPTPRITIQEVQSLQSLRSRQQELRHELDLVDASVTEVEHSVLAKLDQGATPPTGFDLVVKTFQRRYPAWKEWFIRFNGKAKADRILAKTPASISKTVLIRERSQVTVKEAA